MLCKTIELYLRIKYNRNSGESCIVLTLVTECSTQFESWMEDDGEKCLREFDLNIHLYQRLNYVRASEHLKYSARKLYGVL